MKTLVQEGLGGDLAISLATVVDLGSGFGKLAIGCLGPMGFRKVTGIEKEEIMHQYAINLKSLIAQEVEEKFDSVL